MASIKKSYLHPAYKNIRIGVAVADSLNGKWKRFDEPILSPTIGGWDSVVVTNPSPVVSPNGEVYLVYRTFVRGTGHRLGLSKANNPIGPYEKLGNGPISNAQVEDPNIWYQAGKYYIIAKDMTGNITGEKHAGVFLWADDLSVWNIADSSKAYSRTLTWTNGETITMGSLERPFVFQNEKGEPTHIFFATADGPGGFREAQNTWNTSIPLCKKQY